MVVDVEWAEEDMLGFVVAFGARAGRGWWWWRWGCGQVNGRWVGGLVGGLVGGWVGGLVERVDLD